MATCRDCNRDEANCICYRTCPECNLEYSLRFERCPHMQQCEVCEEWTHSVMADEEGTKFCNVCWIMGGFDEDA